MTHILDASAVLAFLNREPGGDIAAARFETAAMSVINAVEVGTKLMDKGMACEKAWEALQLLAIDLVEVDVELARATTALRETTRHKGLSLADRACIATAISRKATVVTADRAWAELDLSCSVELIR